MTQLNPLQKALSAIQSGHRSEARSILRDLVQAEPDNASAWLWLAACEETTAAKMAALQQVLRIHPDHATARQALQQMEAPEPALEDLLWRPHPAASAAAAGPISGAVVLSRPAGRLYMAVLAGVLVLILLVAAAIITLTLRYSLGCGAGASSEQVTIEYVIEGDAQNVSVTYGDGTGSYSQEQAELPWRKTFSMQTNDMPTVSAQSGSDTGSLTCQILVNGQLWKSAVSDVAYGAVSCSGMVGE